VIHIAVVAKVFKDAFAIYRMPEREFIDEEVVEFMHVQPHGDNYHQHPQGEQHPCVTQ
jgi:hypothetical protein